MIEDRLNQHLLNIGFHRVASNAEGIYLYYQAGENGLTVVSVIHSINGDEVTPAQYEHILQQIRENVSRSYQSQPRYLSLIFTRFPDRVKHLCSIPGEDVHWIVDLSANRLMIYETQSNAFTAIKSLLEQLLGEEELLNRKVASGNIPFRMMNTIIVGINMMAYIITHFTGAFGGEQQMYVKGALSWYYVTQYKEYYRILTAMFMHSDLSHIFNNMLVLVFIGATLEQAVGKIKYLFIYFGAGILAGIASISYNMWKESAALYELGNLTFSIGASGAIFGVVGAVFYIMLINKGRLKDMNTRQMVIFLILSLYGGIANAQIDQAAHVGGFVAGLVLAAIVYRRKKDKEPNKASLA